MELSMMRRYWPAKSIFFPEKTRGRPAFISVKIVLVARPVKQSELFLKASPSGSAFEKYDQS